MQFKFWLVAVISIFILFSCSSSKHGKKQKAMPGTWQMQPIEIDGDSKDWPSPYPNYDSKAKIAYATSNDDKNLYITMETGDEQTQMKILKFGMTLSIDTEGKKNNQYSINFPLQNYDDIFEQAKTEDHRVKSEYKNASSKQLMQKIKKSAKESSQYALEGFKSCSGGFMVTQTSPCGIKVKMNIDEYNELVWEASIPLKVLFNNDANPQNFYDKNISICYSIKGYKKPESKTNDVATGNQGMKQGMGSGMRGGGMHGGGGGVSRSQQDNPMQHLYENTKTWKHFLIATKP